MPESHSLSPQESVGVERWTSPAEAADGLLDSCPTMIPPGYRFTFYKAHGLVATPARRACPILAHYGVTRSGLLVGWLVDQTLDGPEFYPEERFEAWSSPERSGYLGAAASVAEALALFPAPSVRPPVR